MPTNLRNLALNSRLISSLWMLGSKSRNGCQSLEQKRHIQTLQTNEQHHLLFLISNSIPLMFRQEGFPAPALADGSASSSTPGAISRWLYFLYSFFDNLLKNAWRAVQFRFFFGESTKYCFQNSKFELFLCEIDWRSGASSIQGTWPC